MSVNPQIAEVFRFLLEHGVLIFGAFLTLAATDGRRFGPIRFLAFIFGIGLVVSGLSHLIP